MSYEMVKAGTGLGAVRTMYRGPRRGVRRRARMYARRIHPAMNYEQTGLGFSLKRPKWMRKLTLKKALPYIAAGAGALLIPGAGAAIVRGAGALVRGGAAAGRFVGREAGGLFRFGRKAVRSAMPSSFPNIPVFHSDNPPIVGPSGIPSMDTESYRLSAAQAQMASDINAGAQYGGGETMPTVSQGLEPIEEAPPEEAPIETSTPGPGKAIAQKLPQFGTIALYGLGAFVLYSLARGVGRRRGGK